MLFLAKLRKSVTLFSSAITYKVIAIVTEELSGLFESPEKPSLHTKSGFETEELLYSKSINDRI